jgi:exopolysaccharide production protein ExoZ
MNDNRHFVSLEIYRGLASLFVVLFHYHFYLSQYFGDSPTLSRVFEGGHAGVEFFFVLSGFIIYYIHSRDIGKAHSTSHFIKKRAIRILPMYWIVISFSVISFIVFPNWGLSKGLTFHNIVFDYFLLPTSGELILSPAWTLKHEALFYALFCMVIFRPVVGVALFCLWQAAVFTTNVAVLMEGWRIDNPYVRYALDIHNIGFGIGVLCGVISIKSRAPSVRNAFLLLVIGVASVATLMIFESLEDANFYGAQTFHEQTILSFLYVLAFSIVILASVGIERSRTITPNPFLVMLGASSYALYLIHDPLGSLLGKVGRAIRVTAFLNENAVYCAAVCIAVGLGAVVHVRVERPLTRALNQALQPPRRNHADELLRVSRSELG